ncbi:kinase-like domain-containing protein [Mariannaea sp. PMI_226]|nr:kinase-like domain-containing protein [Mariannaea sp. PMI_226]
MSIYKKLMDRKVQCPLGRQYFVPLSALDELINKKNIKTLIPFPKLLFRQNLPAKVMQRAQRLFTILVLISETDAICALMQEGLTDEHLPLSLRSDNSYDRLMSRDGKKEFKSFGSWDEVRVTDFLAKQWMVLAPVFSKSSQHVEVDTSCALSLVECKEIAKGHHAFVYRASIHPAHHMGFNTNGSHLEVALKEFRTEESFEKERKNLQRIQSLKHKHLVTIIATCRRDRFYYVIFPWAQGGNLGDFWKREDAKRGRRLTLWALSQMLGLCEALQALHKENCRHGDLKPENILHFKDNDNDLGLLVIADVGVSKFHNKATGLRHDPTDTRATTPAYEAPEAQPDVEGPRSRRYDMWSMGCMFLEFTFWILYGYGTMLEFRSSRKSVDPEIKDGSFYKRTQAPDQDGDDLLHLEVIRAFNTLREDPRCRPGTAFGDLVDLVSQNLIVHVSRRVEATELVGRLEMIISKAEKNPNYLQI